MSEDWRGWVTGSAGAVRLSLWISRVAAVGVVIAAALVIANLILGRPISGAVALLLPAVPAVAVGQAWAIAIVVARQIPRRPASRWRVPAERDPRRVFFQGLPTWQVNAVIAVFFLGWLSGMTAFASLTSGSPTSPAPGCPYRLVNHGTYDCVSRSDYLAAGAAGQRLAAGILGAFLAVHFGVAAGELRRRRTASV
jgi:hypothetical protein